jgi:hypothetical protein
MAKQPDDSVAREEKFDRYYFAVSAEERETARHVFLRR